MNQRSHIERRCDAVADLAIGHREAPDLKGWAAVQPVDKVLLAVDDPFTLPAGTMPMRGFADDMGALERLSSLVKGNPSAQNVAALTAQADKLNRFMALSPMRT